jgi:glycosyltransferase involved in cell wall biosynthesis
MTPMVSILTAVKNRTYYESAGEVFDIMPQMVSSIACLDLDVEIIVADGGTVDRHPREWIDTYRGDMPVKVLDVDGPFNRGKCINRAAGVAESSILAIIQPDMVCPPRLFSRALEIVAEGNAFFPFYTKTNKRGESFIGNGTGNAILNAETFHKAGGWPEYDWMEAPQGPGTDDTEFRNAIGSISPIVRERIDGFDHMQHPKDW